MDIKKENLPKSRVKLTITIPPEKFKIYQDQAFFKLSKITQVKGFRPGKAPRHLVKAEIGADKIFSESLEIALPKTYAEIVTREKIIPLESPKIEIKKFDQNKPLEYTAEVDILPKVSLPDYKKFKVKELKIEVKEQDVERALKDLQKAFATFHSKIDVAKKGDRIEIEFAGFLEGIKQEKLTSKNHPMVLGETKLIPGFEEQLIGMKKGQTKEFEITFPKDNPDPLYAGKKVKFEAKMQKAEKVELPKLDNEFAKKLKKNTILEVKADLRKSIEARAKQQAHMQLEQEIIDKLFENTEFEVPEVLVRSEQNRIIENVTHRAQMYGLSFEQYLSTIKKNKEQLQKDMRLQAEKSAKISVLINEIKIAEKISVAEEDIDKEIESIRKSGQKVEDTEGLRRYIKSVLGNRKTVERLVEYATK